MPAAEPFQPPAVYSPRRPERAEAFNDLGTADQEVLDHQIEPLLPIRGGATLNAAPDLIHPWKPRRCDRHQSQTSQVQDEGAALPEAGGSPLIESECTGRVRRRGPRPTGGATHEGSQADRRRGAQYAGDIPNMPWAGQGRRFALGIRAPDE